MNVYGLLAFVFSVFVRHRETSWPREVFVRSGERRRGTGSAIGVGVCEGILCCGSEFAWVLLVRIDFWGERNLFYEPCGRSDECWERLS
jgi:hypothetical protein